MNKAEQEVLKTLKNGLGLTSAEQEILVNYIDKLQKEIEKKDKVIGLMAEDIRQVIGDDNYMEMTREETIKKYIDKVEKEK